MSQDNGITVFNGDSVVGEDFGQRAKGKAAELAEVREGAFAALILGIGLGTAIVTAFNLGDIPGARTIMVTTVVFGTIEVPRLEELNVFLRLIFLMVLLGIMLLFAQTIPGVDTEIVAFGSLGLLFVASMINATAQAGIGPTGKVKRAFDAQRYGGYFAGAALVAVVSLVF